MPAPAGTDAAGRVRGAAQAVAEVPVDLIELGVLRGAYGLQGWSHVQPFAGGGEALLGTRQWWMLAREQDAGVTGAPEPVALALTGVRVHADALVAKWRGCDDPESAQALKGRRISVSRARFPRLPAGQYYWVDLIGTQVINRAGCSLGSVSSLRNNGAHDLLEVRREASPDGGRGATLLIPVVAAYIDGIDLEQRRIRVDWDEQW